MDAMETKTYRITFYPSDQSGTTEYLHTAQTCEVQARWEEEAIVKAMQTGKQVVKVEEMKS
jgi:hypothetical protein